MVARVQVRTITNDEGNKICASCVEAVVLS